MDSLRLFDRSAEATTMPTDYVDTDDRDLDDFWAHDDDGVYLGQDEDESGDCLGSSAPNVAPTTAATHYWDHQHNYNRSSPSRRMPSHSQAYGNIDVAYALYDEQTMPTCGQPFDITKFMAMSAKDHLSSSSSSASSASPAPASSRKLPSHAASSATVSASGRDVRSRSSTKRQATECKTGSRHSGHHSGHHASQPKPTPSKPSSNPKQRPHYAIEKRYRDNLNGKFEELRDHLLLARCCLDEDFLPEAQASSSSEMAFQQRLEDLRQRFSKTRVLSEALAYIRHLEDENDRLMEAMERLGLDVTGVP